VGIREHLQEGEVEEVATNMLHIELGVFTGPDWVLVFGKKRLISALSLYCEFYARSDIHTPTARQAFQRGFT